jgi:hypothetical protein
MTGFTSLIGPTRAIMDVVGHVCASLPTARPFAPRGLYLLARVAVTNMHTLAGCWDQRVLQAFDDDKGTSQLMTLGPVMTLAVSNPSISHQVQVPLPGSLLLSRGEATCYSSNS